MTDRQAILRLRILVGYLGEKPQSNWWPSSFLTRSSDAFIAPVFGSAGAATKVVGVCEAARRVHDAAIGVGQVFHLFRLPETTEQDLHKGLADADMGGLETVESALRKLGEMACGRPEAKPGPVRIGPLDALANLEWMPLAAAHYRVAFAAGVHSFPYFVG